MTYFCDDGESCTEDLCTTDDTCEGAICTHECADSCPDPTQPLYLLVNDVDAFTFSPAVMEGHSLHLVIADPSIAKFRIGQVLAASIPILAPPVTVDIQGLSAGGTLIGVHLDSPSGPTIACDYLKVGGSIALQFDQLPTYIPYREVTTTAGQQFVASDFQLDGMGDPVLDKIGTVTYFGGDGNTDANRAATYSRLRPITNFAEPNILQTSRNLAFYWRSHL